MEEAPKQFGYVAVRAGTSKSNRFLGDRSLAEILSEYVLKPEVHWKDILRVARVKLDEFDRGQVHS